MKEIYEYVEDVALDKMSAQDAADEILEWKPAETLQKVVTAPKRAAEFTRKALEGPNPKYKRRGKPTSYMRKRIAVGMNPLDVKA